MTMLMKKTTTPHYVRLWIPMVVVMVMAINNSNSCQAAFVQPCNPSSEPGAMTTTSTTTKLHVLTGVETVGIALLSAAAGAATQVPKIQALERDLSYAKDALSSSEEEMADKMKKLEDTLFQMDREYESQTAKFQRQYDRQKQVELEQIKQKLKKEMEYKLEIELENERSKLLTKQLAVVDTSTEKQAELFQLRMQQHKLTEQNLKLERALTESKEEFDHMMVQAGEFSSSRKKLFGLF